MAETQPGSVGLKGPGTGENVAPARSVIARANGRPGRLRPSLRSQAVPEHRKHALGVRAGTGAHGQEQARQQGGQVGAADVGADGAGALGPAEKNGDVRVHDVTIHETTDPEVIVAEYELHGEMPATGEPFSVRFAMVITVRDGHIVRSRDYTDPLTGARLLGRLPELLSALS